MRQGMRFSLFVSLWIVFLACRSSSSREGACRQDDEFQRMGEPRTKTEDVEEQTKEVDCAPQTRVHDGSSSCATPESLTPRPLMPSPPILPTPPLLPSPQPFPLGLPMFTPPFSPAHERGPLPLLTFLPPPPYLLAPGPWHWPLPLYLPICPLHLPMAVHLLYLLFGPAALPFQYFMPIPAPLLPCVPCPGPWPMRVPMHTPAPAHCQANVPRQENLPPLLPLPAPEHLLSRVSARAVMCKFLVDVEAAGKHDQLLALLRDWNVHGSNPDMITGVEQLFEGHPDLLLTFKSLLRQAHQFEPEFVRE